MPPLFSPALCRGRFSGCRFSPRVRSVVIDAPAAEPTKQTAAARTATTTRGHTAHIQVRHHTRHTRETERSDTHAIRPLCLPPPTTGPVPTAAERAQHCTAGSGDETAPRAAVHVCAPCLPCHACALQQSGTEGGAGAAPWGQRCAVEYESNGGRGSDAEAVAHCAASASAVGAPRCNALRAAPFSLQAPCSIGEQQQRASGFVDSSDRGVTVTVSRPPSSVHRATPPHVVIVCASVGVASSTTPSAAIGRAAPAPGQCQCQCH